MSNYKCTVRCLCKREWVISDNNGTPDSSTVFHLYCRCGQLLDYSATPIYGDLQPPTERPIRFRRVLLPLVRPLWWVLTTAQISTAAPVRFMLKWILHRPNRAVISQAELVMTFQKNSHNDS